MSEDEKQESTDEEQQNEAPAEESTPEEATQEVSESAEEAAEEQPDAPAEGETSEETSEAPPADGAEEDGPESEAEPEEAAEEAAEAEDAPEEADADQHEEAGATEADDTGEAPPEEEATPDEVPSEDDVAEEQTQEEAEEGEADGAEEQPSEEEEAPQEPPVQDEAAEEPPETEAEPVPQGSNMGIIVGIVVLAIAIAGILFVLLRKGPSEPAKGEPTTSETKAQPEAPKKLTKEEIAKQKAEEAKRKAQERAAEAKRRAKEKADAIRTLVARLDTDDFVTSSEVKDEILKYRKEAIPALAAALNADSFNLRENAIKTLAAMNLKEAIRPLSVVLATDKSEEVRTAAAQALGTTGNLAAVDPLIKAVADSSTDVQDAAIEGLEAITRNYKLMETDEEDGKALQKIWADWWAKNKAKLAAEMAPKEKKDVPMHLHAFRATSNMHPMAHLHPCSEEVPGGALHGEEGSHKLLRYLATLKAADLMAAMQGDAEWLLKAAGIGDPAKLCLKIVAPKDDLTHYIRGRLWNVHIEEVKKGGAKPSAAVQKYLTDRLREEIPTDPVLRANAARQLGDMKAMEALPVLAKSVNEDPHPSVKLLAARAICKIGDAKVFQETALPYLAGIVKDGKARPEIKAAAAFALGESGQKEAVEPLLAAVGSPLDDLRRRAHDGLVAVTKNESIKWDKSVTPQKLQEQWQTCLKQSQGK